MDSKTILITGSTDGIGLNAAGLLAARGHRLILHGRTPAKLEAAQQAVAGSEGVVGDLSVAREVEAMADEVASLTDRLDVLINNAGVLKAPSTRTPSDLDLRFVVNTLAPYALTRRLLPTIPSDGRVVNVSSAAQSPVDLNALVGKVALADMTAYAQSKLAITMWSAEVAQALGSDGPAIIAVNPGSMLGSKMVKEGFGVAGGDIGIGGDILMRAAVSDEFETATGRYFDNDSGRFAVAHADVANAEKRAALMKAIDAALGQWQSA